MDWITGKKAQEQYGFSVLDWMALVREGLQPHYSNGDIMPPPDLDVRRKDIVHSAFKIKDKRREIARIQELKKAGEPNYGIPFFKSESNPLSFESQVARAEQEIRANIKRLRTAKNYVKRSEKGSWGAFEIPTAHKSRETVEREYRSLHEILGDALYRKERVEQLVQGERSDPGAGVPGGRKELSESEAEKFVSNLRVQYENDYEITIQEPKRQARNYNHHSLGCIRNDTKEWEALICLLEGSDHLFRTDKPRFRTRKPGKPTANIKILNEIDSKLKLFFNKEFGVRLPDSFRTFDHVPAEGTGAYRFKFKVGAQEDPLDFKGYTNEGLLGVIQSLQEIPSKKGNDSLFSAYAEAKKRGLGV